MKSIRKIELRFSRTALVAEDPILYQKIHHSRSIADISKSIIGNEVTEVMLVFMLDVKLGIVGYTEVARGGVAQCSIKPADIFRPAIAIGAYGIIMVHNHPSGEPSPSTEDIAFLRRIRDAGKLIGLQVLDNLIVTEKSYFSFMDTGLMSGPEKEEE